MLLHKKNICDMLNPTNISDIESEFLLGDMLLLKYCRDYILNHCSEYGPLISRFVK